MPSVHANGLELTYERLGAGDPLLLVSGIGEQLVSWPRGFLEALAARGLEVIVFDNRDTGLSTRLSAAGTPRVRRLLARALVGLPVRAPYTLFDMANDAAALLDALGISRAHVAGFSLGGMVAQCLAIEHGARVRSLASVMSSSGGRLLTAGRPAATLKLLQPPSRSREEAMFKQVDFYRAAGSTRFFRDELAIAERAGAAFDRAYDPRGFARQFAAVLATGDLRARLAAVRAPTLVLHGTADGIFRPVCARDTARAIPGARLELVEGWGHDLPEGAWPVVADALAEHARRS